MNTLIIFSGLPGTGKSTLANRLARELRWPLLRLDDVVNNIPENAGTDFWDSQIEVLLTLTEAQLEIDLSVVVDAVFMNMDRHHAQALARKHQAHFRPIYTHLSDEKIWEQRLTARYVDLNNSAVATWERVKRQREHFRNWEPDTALFVDALNTPDENFTKVLHFATSEVVAIRPLEDILLVVGKYH